MTLNSCNARNNISRNFATFNACRKDKWSFTRQNFNINWCETVRGSSSDHLRPCSKFNTVLDSPYCLSEAIIATVNKAKL